MSISCHIRIYACMFCKLNIFFLKEKNFNSEVTFIYVVVRDSITISNSYVLNLDTHFSV